MNHTETYVDAITGCHTNTIEGTWYRELLFAVELEILCLENYGSLSGKDVMQRCYGMISLKQWEEFVMRNRISIIYNNNVLLL